MGPGGVRRCHSGMEGDNLSIAAEVGRRSSTGRTRNSRAVVTFLCRDRPLAIIFQDYFFGGSGATLGTGKRTLRGDPPCSDRSD